MAYKNYKIKSTGGLDYVIYKVPENTIVKIIAMMFSIDLNSYARAKFSVGVTFAYDCNGRKFADSLNRKTGRICPTWGPIEISLDSSHSIDYPKWFSTLIYEPLGPGSFIKITATSPVEEITTMLTVCEYDS